MKKILFILLALILSNIFLVSAVSVLSVTSYPSEIVPGEIAEIKIDIKNTLNYDVYNVEVKLDLEEDIPFVPYQSGSAEFEEKLSENEKESFVFKVMALPTAASGVYKIPVLINYDTDNNGTSATEKKQYISLIINSVPELKISTEDSVLIKGKENTFSIKITNFGLTDVKFAYVNAADVSGIELLTEKEQYIGNIDSDDFDSVEYKIYIEADAEDSITIPVILRYKDATNREFTETKEIIVKTYSLKEAQRLGLVAKTNFLLYLIVPAVVILFVIYRIRKRRKLKRKNM